MADWRNMAVYRDICGNKHNSINVDDIILFGESKYFNSDEVADYDYFTKFIYYRGLSAKLTNSGLTKDEAVANAETQYKSEFNRPFFNGEIPFILVANLRGDLKWCVLSGNLNANEFRLKELIKNSAS